MSQILDTASDLGHAEASSQELCDYCTREASYLTEYGLLCSKHAGFVRLWRKAWA